MLMLGMNGAIESNVFRSSVNGSINVRVNADVLCEWVLGENVVPLAHYNSF